MRNWLHVMQGACLHWGFPCSSSEVEANVGKIPAPQIFSALHYIFNIRNSDSHLQSSIEISFLNYLKEWATNGESKTNKRQR
jgi:hypothetical protein